MEGDLGRAGPVAIFGMLVSLIPLVVAFAYMLRPAERMLALMRPLSLATIFGALNTFLSGLAAVFRMIPKAQTATGYDVEHLTHALSESITPMFVAFGFLTVAWICVAVGMRRE